MNLPSSPNLPVEHLAAGFSDVTNSYKFYWFLGILEHIRENQSPVISLDSLLTSMIAGVWYPTNYFRLSFGKQDRLGQIALQIGNQAGLTADSKRVEVVQTVQTHIAQNSPIAREIRSLGNYVPYRFLRPFFAVQLRGLADWRVNATIMQFANQTFIDPQRPCLYRFVSQLAPAIEIHPAWFDYLVRHYLILAGFCLWHLVNYLQKHNPNIPNVSGKLFEPAERDLRLSREFWRLVSTQTGQLTCIYSGQSIQQNDFSLDHFLPWRFVAHDLLWNIIPTPKNINSSKSDNLPDFNRYFELFALLQYQAVRAVASTRKQRLLEDHIALFGVSSVSELQKIPFADFQDKLRAVLAPQFQIAANAGFSTGWIYV